MVDDSTRARYARDYRCTTGHSQPLIYHDRLPHRQPSHSYDYWDRHDRYCNRIIWPGYRCRVYYPCHFSTVVAWHYPFYHRKYLFVSIGGWWPSSYSYARYYWYGWHPYNWYGYSPVPRELGDTYNSYTYNYYGTDVQATGTTNASPMPGALAPTNQMVEPSEIPNPGPADEYFDAGVQAFEAGQYNMAASSFQQAMAQAPEDRVLPFAYAQALFAAEQYNDAVGVLRLTLEAPRPADEPAGVFYPRGLYPDDDSLFLHIDRFMDVQENQPRNPGYQLLVGYHLLGIGEVTLARDYLQAAQQDPTYTTSAATLLELADRLEQETPVPPTE